MDFNRIEITEGVSLKKNGSRTFRDLTGPFEPNKFFPGYIQEGAIQVVLNICTCATASVSPVIGRIIYLTMSDEQFDETAVQNRKAWF